MDILFFTHLLNALLMISMPVALAIFLARRWKLGWRLWLVGAAGFVISQVGHIPFNAWMSGVLNQTALVHLSPANQTLFNAVFLGLSAGLFEELTRYAVLRWWLKDARSWRRGVLAGAGHGGVEAILLGCLALYAFLQFSALRTADLSTIVSPTQLAQAQQQVAAYWSGPWYAALLGALERLFTIVIQVSLAVIVLQALTRKQWWWVGLAVLYHALLDGVSLLVLKPAGIYGTEAIVGGFALLSLGIIFALRRPEPLPEPASEAAVPSQAAVPPDLKPVEETPENLDNSRFI